MLTLTLYRNTKI